MAHPIKRNHKDLITAFIKLKAEHDIVFELGVDLHKTVMFLLKRAKPLLSEDEYNALNHKYGKQEE